VGCIGASGAGGETTTGASVGLCNVAQAPDGSGGGAGDGDPVDSGGGAAGAPADDGSGTGVLAAVTRGATGNLPLTGRPVWIVLFTGLTLIAIGRRCTGAVCRRCRTD
jgi:hypothetical protein